MFSRRAGLLAVLAWFIFHGHPSAQAQRRAPAEITIEGSRGFALLMDDFAGPFGGEARDLLAKNLARDGQFQFPAAATRGAWSVRARAENGRLEGSLQGAAGNAVLRQTYRDGSLRQLVARFSDDIVRSVTGGPGIATSRILFVSDRSGHKELYLCDAGGGEIRQITRDRSLCVSPSLSADGRLAAFTSYAGGYADVHILDLAAGTRRRAFAEPGTNTGAAFAPSGNEIALTMSFPGNPEIFVGPLAGGRARRLTANRFVDASPDWSPDGRHLVFVSDGNGRPQLFIVAAGGGRPLALDTGFPECYEPNWSPDGKRIAFTVRSGGAHQVAVYDLQKKSSQVVTRGGGSEQPAWGPSSRHLIYLEDNAIVVHELESGVRDTVLRGFGSITEVAWTR